MFCNSHRLRWKFRRVTSCPPIKNNLFPIISFVTVSACCRRVGTSMATKSSTEYCAVETRVISLRPYEMNIASTCCPAQQLVHPALAQAAEMLTANEVVAFPTETVYGLGANALSTEAVSRVYAAKNRPADNPLIVHISSLDMLRSLYPPGWALPAIYDDVVRELWPGPLTILLPRSPLVPGVVTCGQPTMAVRMPAHPVALALITACGFPLAAPSANSSGRPSPTLARHVLADLEGRISLILDGGACSCGVESTVLDGLRSPPAILRPGGITQEQLLVYPGLEGLQMYRRDFIDSQLEAAPSTPGMKYRHYSPSAPVLLLDPGDTPPATVSDEDLVARLKRGSEVLIAELSLMQQLSHGDGAVGVVEGAGPSALRGTWNALREPEIELIGILRTSLLGLRPGPLSHQQFVTVAFGTSSLESATEVIAPDVEGATTEVKGALKQQVSAACQLSFGEGGRLPLGLESPACCEYVLGYVSRPAEVASELFTALRYMDEVGVGVIVVEGVRDAGAGVAVMNRLRKAASRVIPV